MNQSKNKLIEFFSKPAVGISGSIASIIGLVLAILFYTNTQKNREH